MTGDGFWGAPLTYLDEDMAEGEGLTDGGRHYTLDEAAALLKDIEWAAWSRFGGIAASPDRARVAVYGDPVPGAEIARRLAS